MSAVDQSSLLYDNEQWLSLADGQQTLLDGVSLGFGERAALGQAVDGVERGVDERGVMLCPGEVRSAAGQQRQHGRTDVPVHSQSRFCGAQSLLGTNRAPQMIHMNQKDSFCK